MMEGLRSISVGGRDLTCRLAVKSRDEARELSGCFNGFMERPNGMFGRFKV